MTLEEHLFRLWNDGATPRRAVQRLRRQHGVILTFEQVRTRFAAIAAELAGPGVGFGRWHIMKLCA